MKNGGLTSETVEAALREKNGNLAAVGRAFGVTRQAVWKFLQTRPTLKAAADDVREGMKDNAESVLQSAVLRGEAWAVCFFLKCQAKDRGYVERQEHTGKDGGPMEAEVTDARTAPFRERYAVKDRGNDDPGKPPDPPRPPANGAAAKVPHP